VMGLTLKLICVGPHSCAQAREAVARVMSFNAAYLPG